MTYTKDEAFDEVVRRGRQLKIKKAKRTAAALSVMASGLTVALVVAIEWFGGAGTSVYGKSAYGSFLLPVESGGYVLAAVIAFAAGVLVTVEIQRSKTRWP